MDGRLRRVVHRLAWRVGRRGASLIILGAVFTLYGVLLVIASKNIDVDEIPKSVRIIAAIAPFDVWGWLWIGTGVLSGVQAALPTKDGRASFSLLSFLSGVWASGYVAGWIVMEPPRDPTGLLSGVLWVAMLLLTFVLAGWKEDPRRYRREHGSGGRKE